MTLLILYGVLAIAVSFLCSLLEAGLLSLPRSYVESLVERGSRAGVALREMKDNIDRPLAAILTLNTIAHTIGAAGVGAQAAVVFGSAAVGIASAVMTLLILVLSEIIPKTLGAVYARPLAAPVAATIRGMIIVCYPIIVPLEWLNRALGHHRGAELMSRAEMLAAIRLGHSTGAMDRREYLIASNLIALAEIPVAQILTPRTVVFSLPESITVGEVVAEHSPLRFGRIPVYAEDREHITGYVTRSGIHETHARGDSAVTLRTLSQPIAVVPELADVGATLEQFMKNREHIGLVVDEFGAMAGIVTLEDLLETLLGEEIIDETDTIADMQELARRRARRRREARREIGPE